MTDLHSHILYGIDDGCEKIEESIELLSKMQDIGFNKIILTPHYISNSNYNSNRSDNLKRLELLKQKVNDNKIKIELFLGNEIFLDNNILNLLKKEIVSTMGDTKYILFELPFNDKINNLLDIIYEIKYNGFIPILAHPERYTYMQKNHEMILELKNEGVLFQGNYSSVIGYYGKKAQKMFKFMLKNHYYDFLGTDIHSPKKTFVLDNFDKIQNKIIKLTSKEYYEKLVENGDILTTGGILK